MIQVQFVPNVATASLRVRGEADILELNMDKMMSPQLLVGHLFMSLTYSKDLTVISTHAGRKPLRMAVLAEPILAHAQQ